MPQAIHISPIDNVVVALHPIAKGTLVEVDGLSVTALEDIPQGHKMAVKPIKNGENVIKYGFPIGHATADAAPGSWMHTHNVHTNLSGEVEYSYNPAPDLAPLPKVEPETFMGFRRKDGRAAIRNEIWIIPTVGCVNDIAKKIVADNQDLVTGSIEGLYTFTHPFGCSQTGHDHAQTRKLLAALVRHPNAAAVLVLSLGCENLTHEQFLTELGDYDHDRVKFLTCQDVEDEFAAARDILKELADACHNGGLSLHLYYSHLDWRRLDYPLGRTGKKLGRPTDKQNWRSYYTFMNNQLRELLTNYGRVDCIWFDGWWDHDEGKTPFNWELDEQYAMIHQLQPQCIVANNHHGKPYPGEDIQIFEQDLPGENTYGLSGQDVSQLPLETCLTMNYTWGYSITDKNYKSKETLVRELVRAAGKNCNLLLNVGPRPDGQLPVEAVERLQYIGQFLGKYGDTIYGTRGGLVAPHDWGVSTQKGNRLFIHILSLQDKALFVPTGDRKVKAAKVFINGKKVEFKAVANGYVLTLPEQPSGDDYVVELTLA